MSEFKKAFDELFLLNKGRGPDKQPRKRSGSSVGPTAYDEDRNKRFHRETDAATRRFNKEKSAIYGKFKGEEYDREHKKLEDKLSAEHQSIADKYKEK